MFHALGKEQIRADRRVAAEARGAHRGGAGRRSSSSTASLVDHLAEVGYDPEFGARMLKRRVRSEVEAWLADAMLRDDVKPGERIRLTYDPGQADGNDRAQRSRRQCRSQPEAGELAQYRDGTMPSLLFVPCPDAASRGGAPRNSRTFGVCPINCRPAFRNGGSTASPSRYACIAVSPPPRCSDSSATSTYVAAAVSSVRRTNSPRGWMPGHEYRSWIKFALPRRPQRIAAD